MWPPGRAGDGGVPLCPWERARFLALRTELAQGWQPRNGVERQLVDTLVQAQAAMYHWQEVLMARAALDVFETSREVKSQGKWTPLRVTDAQAMEQAAGMVDRFNRIFLRTLRALRDLRRCGPTVVVQNAAQVNVGEQQINVAG